MQYLVGPLLLLLQIYFLRADANFLHNRFIEAAKSREALNQSFQYIAERASDVYGGVDSTFELAGSGAWGVILRINFTDGESWAAKLSYKKDLLQTGWDILWVMGRNCPWVRAPRIHGEMEKIGDTEIFFYFADWVEGTHWQLPQGKMIDLGVWEAPLPDNLLSQLTDFIYNVTNCPLNPHDTWALTRADFWDTVEGKKIPSSRLWTFNVIAAQLEPFRISNPAKFAGVNGMDILLLYSWAFERMKAANEDRFALNYFDLRRANFYVDQQQDLQGVFDWDGVLTVPLKLAGITLEDLLFPEIETAGNGVVIKMDPGQKLQFLERYISLENSRGDMNRLSPYFNESLENRFLDLLLVHDWVVLQFGVFKSFYPEIYANATERTPEALAAAAALWNEVTEIRFLNKNRPIPDWPQLIEMQVGLGISKTGFLANTWRKAKAVSQRQALVVLSKLPQWISMRKWHCRLAAAVTETYVFNLARLGKDHWVDACLF